MESWYLIVVTPLVTNAPEVEALCIGIHDSTQAVHMTVGTFLASSHKSVVSGIEELTILNSLVIFLQSHDITLSPLHIFVERHQLGHLLGTVCQPCRDRIGQLHMLRLHHQDGVVFRTLTCKQSLPIIVAHCLLIPIAQDGSIDKVHLYLRSILKIIGIVIHEEVTLSSGSDIVESIV